MKRSQVLLGNEEMAREIFRKHGAEALKSVSKFHFKTFAEVTGMLPPATDAD
jgi:ribonuclease HIII